MRTVLACSRRASRWVLTGVLGLAGAMSLSLFSTPPAMAGGRGNANPGIVPPSSHAHGQSYEALAADWLDWFLQIPVDQNPAFDSTGVLAATDQSGSVWFLAGSGDGEPVTREVTIPPGKALFFPLINEFWVSFPTDPAWDEPFTDPNTGVEYDTFQDWVIDNILDPGIDAVTDLSCRIDGQRVKLSPAYRILSEVSDEVILPDDNVFGGADAGVPGGLYGPCQNEGYYLMLAPLSAGKHTVHFTATVGQFSIDVTYHLTVGKCGK